MTNQTAPHGATILVAEDEDDLRKVVRLLLGRAGFTVHEARTGREALDLVLEHGPEIDAVLLDVMMPEMNGHEALPVMREAVPDLPVVFCSGFDENEVAEHLSNPSAYTAFLAKPFDRVVLVEQMQRAVASRS